MNNSESVKQQLEAHHNLYTQRIAKLKQENEELKDTATGLRVELDKQKTRLKEHITRLEQENEEIRKINDANAKLMVKLRDCLDCIEDIAQRIPLTSYYRKQILQKIKQAKEGGGMKNIDKIRQMNSEELAEFLQETFDKDEEYFGCYSCINYETHHYPKDCGDCYWLNIGGSIKKWLESES